jgi:hypothetical protein
MFYELGAKEEFISQADELKMNWKNKAANGILFDAT